MTTIIGVPPSNGGAAPDRRDNEVMKRVRDVLDTIDEQENATPAPSAGIGGPIVIGGGGVVISDGSDGKPLEETLRDLADAMNGGGGAPQRPPGIVPLCIVTSDDGEHTLVVGCDDYIRTRIRNTSESMFHMAEFALRGLTQDELKETMKRIEENIVANGGDLGGEKVLQRDEAGDPLLVADVAGTVPENISSVEMYEGTPFARASEVIARIPAGKRHDELIADYESCLFDLDMVTLGMHDITPSVADALRALARTLDDQSDWLPDQIESALVRAAEARAAIGEHAIEDALTKHAEKTCAIRASEAARRAVLDAEASAGKEKENDGEEEEETDGDEDDEDDDER